MTTQLEAVNTMLRSIGQYKVETIPAGGTSDARMAADVLDEYTRELQTDGYDFNSTEGEELPIDVDGKIPVPLDTIRLNATDGFLRVTPRSGFLYNLDEQTDVFDAPVKVDRVFQVDFELLPYVLKRYVVIRSSRVFTNRVVGAGELNAYNQEDEVRARLAWMNSVAEDMQLNVLSTRTHHRPNTTRPINSLYRL